MKFMKTSVLTSQVMVATIFLSAILSCRTHPDSSRTLFGWEDDLKPVEDSAAKNVRRPLEYDPNFCNDTAVGRCFSLILRIPSSDLINDMGLTTLALAAESKTLLTRMQEACTTSFHDYKNKYMTDLSHPLRGAFTRRVLKMRCIFHFMPVESIMEDIKLHDNEIALSVRLTNFNIEGVNQSADINFLKLSADSTFVTSSFRSAAIYAGAKVISDGSWRLLNDIGPAPITSKNSLGRNISWGISLAGLKENLDRIDSSAPASTQGESLRTFINKSKSTLSSLDPRSAPLGSSVLLIGMGYNAYKTICGEDSARCKYSSTTTSRTGQLGDDLKDLIPTSETNETMRLALIKSITGILDQTMERGSSYQIRRMYDLQ